MRISNKKHNARIVAADEFEVDAEVGVESDEEVDDKLDDLSDTLDEIGDAIQDFAEDEPDIEIENNITDHFIAECEKCHNVFITAIEDSGEVINDISGICPVCDEESLQKIRWVIRKVAEPGEEVEEADTALV